MLTKITLIFRIPVPLVLKNSPLCVNVRFVKCIVSNFKNARSVRFIVAMTVNIYKPVKLVLIICVRNVLFAVVK